MQYGKNIHLFIFLLCLVPLINGLIMSYIIESIRQRYVVFSLGKRFYRNLRFISACELKYFNTLKKWSDKWHIEINDTYTYMSEFMSFTLNKLNSLIGKRKFMGNLSSQSAMHNNIHLFSHELILFIFLLWWQLWLYWLFRFMFSKISKDYIFVFSRQKSYTLRLSIFLISSHIYYFITRLL